MVSQQWHSCWSLGQVQTHVSHPRFFIHCSFGAHTPSEKGRDNLLHLIVGGLPGPDAIPAMAIMVLEVGAYIHWAGMLVHMTKSKIVGVNFKTGERVATDSVTLYGVLPFAALAPDEHYKIPWSTYGLRLRVISLQKSSIF